MQNQRIIRYKLKVETNKMNDDLMDDSAMQNLLSGQETPDEGCSKYKDGFRDLQVRDSRTQGNKRFSFNQESKGSQIPSYQVMSTPVN